jgi:NAD(P)-dependent dehydrogenase (short-subunit alcohol dehydrogenase family)
MFDLSNKTAVVVGGTSGIGLVLAKALAQAGADVVPTGRRANLIEAAACEIRTMGRRSLVWPADVTDTGSLQSLLDAVLKDFSSVDILVNCAGQIMRKPTIDLTESEWDGILNTNLNGTLRACQIFGRHMIERRWGRVINIASLSSFVGLLEVAAYGASKSGVLSLTRSLAVEWAPHNVCVNAIVPGVFITELNSALLTGTDRGKEFLMRTPMKRFGRVEELGGAAVYLASDEASFTTGQTLVVDGGFLASGVNQ